jgi:hypothetical protein
MAANFSNSDTFSAAASSSSILSPVFSVAPIPRNHKNNTQKTLPFFFFVVVVVVLSCRARQRGRG